MVASDAVGSRVLPTLLLCLCLASASTTRAASFSSTWLGGTGNWSEAPRWSGAIAPHNAGGDSFDVQIDGGNAAASRVTLDSVESIGALAVDAGDALELTTTGRLTLEGMQLANSGELLLHGVGDFFDAALVTSAEGTLLTGGGAVRMDGGGIRVDGGDASTPGLVNADNAIRGWGVINGAGFVNQGLIEADVAGQTLSIVGGANDGVVRAVGGASAFLSVSGTGFQNRGVIEATGGSFFGQSDRTTSIGATYSARGSSSMDLAGGFVSTHFSTDAGSVIRFVGGDLPYLQDSVLDGSFTGNTVGVAGTLENRGTYRGGLDPIGPATVANLGHLILDATNATNAGDELTLTGGGTVEIGGSYSAEIRAPLRNLDNQMSGRGFMNRLVENGGVIAAANGELDVRSVGGVDHSGTFAALPGGTLVMEANVSGTGDWLADGGQIRVTGTVGTTGNIAVLHGGSLVVANEMSGNDLVVDAASSLDVAGALRVAGNVDFDGPNAGRWSFATGALLEARGGAGAAVGAWSDWQSLEAAGRDLGLLAAGFSSGNFYLPQLVIGPDGHLLLRDGRDNGNRDGAPESLYVDTLVFSDSLGLLDLNGIRLYYNHLVGSPDQIIDVLAPEPAAAWLLGVTLAALAAGRRRAAHELRRSEPYPPKS